MSHITSNVSPCLGIVWVVALPWVKMGDPWLFFLDVPMVLVSELSPGDIVAKLLNLFVDVVEEDIARPSPNHHYSINWSFA